MRTTPTSFRARIRRGLSRSAVELGGVDRFFRTVPQLAPSARQRAAPGFFYDSYTTSSVSAGSARNPRARLALVGRSTTRTNRTPASFRATETLGSRRDLEFHPVGMQRFVSRGSRRDPRRRRAPQIAATSESQTNACTCSATGSTELFRPTAGPRVQARSCVRPHLGSNKASRSWCERSQAAARRAPVLVDETIPLTTRASCSEARRGAGRLRITVASRPTKLALYQRASLVVCRRSTRVSAFPQPRRWRCGATVVASRAGALPEVMETGGGGLLVAPGDPDALAKALRRCGTARGARATPARSAARIVAAYSWRASRSEPQRLYRRVCSGARRPTSTTTSASDGERAARRRSV